MHSFTFEVPRSVLNLNFQLILPLPQLDSGLSPKPAGGRKALGWLWWHWSWSPGCLLVPAPLRHFSHCSLAQHSPWLAFPSFASPSRRRFNSDFLFSSFPPSQPKGRTIPGKEKCSFPHIAETFAGSSGEESVDFGEHMAKSIWGFSDGKWPMRSQRGFIYKW